MGIRHRIRQLALVLAVALGLTAGAAGMGPAPAGASVSGWSTPSGNASCPASGDTCDTWVSAVHYSCYNYWIHSTHDWIGAVGGPAKWTFTAYFEWACANPHVIGAVVNGSVVDRHALHIYEFGYDSYNAVQVASEIKILYPSHPDAGSHAWYTLCGYTQPGASQSYAATDLSATITPLTLTSGRNDSLLDRCWKLQGGTYISGGADPVYDLISFNSQYVDWVYNGSGDNTLIFELM